MKRSHALLCSALSLCPAAALASAPDTEAVEFYNAATRHYFVTASASEARALEVEGAALGWMRTGRSFQAWLTKDNAPADAKAVCRFYSAGTGSYLFTGDSAECAELRGPELRAHGSAGTSRGWQFEGIAFYVAKPKAGLCTPGMTALMRLRESSAQGEGLNERFVDDVTLEESLVADAWTTQGVAFCAASKSTGTNANLTPTTTGFAALAGTWKGTAAWESEARGVETEVVLPLELTVTADGAITGSGNGCTFTGQVTMADGFRSLFASTITASGCTNAAFNGEYRRLRIERFGANMLIVRLKKGDGESEASISARLVNTSAAPPVTSTSFSGVAGEWTGTVAWQAEASGQPQVDVNRVLSLTISSTGAVIGTGLGCTFAGTLLPGNPANREGFGGAISAAGCENALFNGAFDRVRIRVKRNAGRLEVSLQRESAVAEVQIEGALDAKDAAVPVPPVAANATLVGAWQGNVAWFAAQRSTSGDLFLVASASERLDFTIAQDGTFAGKGFGCTLAGKLVLSADSRAALSGEVNATGCTKDVFNGKYLAPELKRDDGALEVKLEREERAAAGSVSVKIAGKVAKA